LTEFVEGSAFNASSCLDRELPELFEFQRRMYRGLSSDHERVTWFFDENPCRDTGGRSLWISRHDGRIVATTVAILFDLQVGAETCRASWGINWMIDPQWRGIGIREAQKDAVQHSCRIACGLGFTEAGRRASLRQGYVDVGTLQTYAFLVSPTALPRIARPLARVAGAVTRWMARLRSKGTELVPIEAFDEQADAIWARASPAYSVIGRRDAARLRWRFDQCPDRDAYLRFYVRDRQHIVGYLVMRRRPWRDTTALTIVDYLVEPRTTAALLGCAVAITRQHGDTVLFWPTLETRATLSLRSLGFVRLRRKRAPLMVLFLDEDDPLRPIVENPKNWFATAADSDVDIQLLRSKGTP
jgi:hypothetical protein